tara:strand:- start:284 stop:784 length:501 start_codon:yes stop_codon:yes gene_type:complete
MRQTTLYRHFDINKKLLYVGISSRPWTRLKEHKISPWYDKIHNITLQQYENREKAIKAEREAVIKENPLFNVQRFKTYKEQKRKEKEIIDNSKLKFISNVVHFKMSYSLQEVRQITKLTMLDIKELLRKDHLSYYEIQWRANHKIKKVPGWAVIDLIEHLTYGRDK